ncbi:MAG: START domain-containing protein [Candidatus Neomarinimicrobiota bacterium]|nr:START domain-containing protein [Candidatus Neomarinimicrobiota bacterium]
MLQDKPVKIEWQEYKGFPISRAETILNHGMESIADAIQDLDNYQNIFERVTKTRRLDQDIVQIILDMPFPFDGRDYIVKYKIENSEDSWVFSFSSVKHPDGPVVPDHVRLPNAAGIWVLERLSSNQTRVIYAWNGELLGNFPGFGLSKAWIRQGTEVLNWLDEALSGKGRS